MTVLLALIFAYLSRRYGWLLSLLTSWVAVLLADLGPPESTCRQASHSCFLCWRALS
jgi:hypothetical protein